MIALNKKSQAIIEVILIHLEGWMSTFYGCPLKRISIYVNEKQK